MIGSAPVPFASIRDPRVMIRLAKLPVRPLISVPASIVSTTFNTAVVSASVPSTTDISPLPLPTVTREAMNQTLSDVSVRLVRICAGSWQTSLPSSCWGRARVQSGQTEVGFSVGPLDPSPTVSVVVILITASSPSVHP